MPVEPVDDVETMYGITFSPSNRADEALPAEVESKPEIINIRSDWIIELPACVFCRGTMVSCATVVPSASVESGSSSILEVEEKDLYR